MPFVVRLLVGGRMRLILFFLFLSIYSITIFGQDEKDEESLKKGEEIIKLCRNSIYKEANTSLAKSLFISFKSKSQKIIKTPLDNIKTLEISSENIEENTFFVQGTDQIKIYSLEKNNKNSGTRKINIFNNNQIYAKWETLTEEGFVDYNLQFQKLGIKPVDYTTIIDKNYFINNIWIYIFPIYLDNSFDKEAKFKYIGKAASTTVRADIVEIKSDSLKLETRMFFDENTHLLLMMTVSSPKENKINKATKSYYYSNYKLVNGILVPQLIKTKEFYISRKDFREETIEIQKETEIISIKVNPKFNAKEFEIKEDKKSKTKQ